MGRREDDFSQLQSTSVSFSQLDWLELEARISSVLEWQQQQQQQQQWWRVIRKLIFLQRELG